MASVASVSRTGLLGLLSGLSIMSTMARSAEARLIMEPVINRVPGTGQAENNFPLYNPDFKVNGVAYWLADEPGEVDSYVAGDPPDPLLDFVHVWNNTRYEVTGLHFRLVGTGTDTQNPGTIVRGPVDAVWGDADGDGEIGRSDIFSTIIVSADGKELEMTGGVIPVGGRFTDIHRALGSSPPELAAVDSWFTGRAVPEPSSAAAAAAAAALALLALRRRGR